MRMGQQQGNNRQNHTADQHWVETGRSSEKGAPFVFFEVRVRRVRRRERSSMERKMISRPSVARGMEHFCFGRIESLP